ncbi:hypothetical protein SAVIM338S_06296 [Streptomyces avidinii]
MAKRKQVPVLPTSVWASRGRALQAGLTDAVSERLEGLHSRGMVEDCVRCADPAHARVTDFMVRWRVPQGPLVRARLVLRDVPEQHMTVWQAVAEADRAWDWSWPSPMALFWPPEVTWDLADQSSVGLYTEPVRVPSTPAERHTWLKESTRNPHAISVVVHTPDPSAAPGAPLHDALPQGMSGRVLEYRVGDDGREAVNQELREVGVSLPYGGAVIVPFRPPRPGLSPASLIVRDAADKNAVREAVVRCANAPWPTASHVLVLIQDVRDAWPLESDAERLEQALAALAVKDRRIEELTAQHDSLQTEADQHHYALRQARTAAREAQARERERDAALTGLRRQLTTLKEQVQFGTLTAALEEAKALRETAEKDAEAAEELLDAQAEEIVRLRARLADAEHTGSDLPDPVSAPTSWEELAARCNRDLTHLKLADISTTIRPLRGHILEPVWLTRSWHTLQTLNSYAHAKAEHGPGLLPHLAAYLRWPRATHLIPATRHAPSESERLTSNTRLRETRCFPVPRTIDPTGLTFMGEHIRIGSGRPPAPRLHLYDDTSGRTRHIHIGYIGAHLP